MARKSNTANPNPVDLHDLIEAPLLAYEAEAKAGSQEHSEFPMPTHLVRWLLDRSKQLGKLRGGQRTPARQQVREVMDVLRVQTLAKKIRAKAKPSSERIKKGGAMEDAAREVSKQSKLSSEELLYRARGGRQRRSTS